VEAGRSQRTGRRRRLCLQLVDRKDGREGESRQYSGTRSGSHRRDRRTAKKVAIEKEKVA